MVIKLGIREASMGFGKVWDWLPAAITDRNFSFLSIKSCYADQHPREYAFAKGSLVKEEMSIARISNFETEWFCLDEKLGQTDWAKNEKDLIRGELKVKFIGALKTEGQEMALEVELFNGDGNGIGGFKKNNVMLVRGISTGTFIFGGKLIKIKESLAPGGQIPYEECRFSPCQRKLKMRQKQVRRRGRCNPTH